MYLIQISFFLLSLSFSIKNYLINLPARKIIRAIEMHESYCTMKSATCLLEKTVSLDRLTQIHRKRQPVRRSKRGIFLMASINQLSRDSSLNDTMRVEKTVPRHDRVCHYCITYKAPSRPRMPHTNEIASRSRGGYYKTYGKSDLPGTSRMQGYDCVSPGVAALNRALICTLNID